MADSSQMVPENVRGRFFVDLTCIDCEVCQEIAPANFQRQAVGGYSYVYRQPRDADEIDACRRALDECPVAAIGDIVADPHPPTT
jgi:ferredoxin